MGVAEDNTQLGIRRKRGTTQRTGDQPADPARWRLRRRAGSRWAGHASVRELDAAVKGLSGAKKKGKRSPDELAAHNEAATTQAALRKLGAKDAVVTAARISGEWWLRAQVRVGSSAVLHGGSGGTASPTAKTPTAKTSKTRKSSKDPAPKPSKRPAPKPVRKG